MSLLLIDINAMVMHGCIYPFTDLLLGYLFAIFESIKIHRGDWFIRTTAERDHLDAFPMVLYTIQVCGFCMNTCYTESDYVMYEHSCYCFLCILCAHTPRAHYD